jgi:hypothetical protein
MGLDMIRVLRCEEGLAGVRWALLDPEPLGVLRGALASLLPDTGTLGDMRLTRAKYKPGRHLTTYYDVRLHDQATGAGSTRAIEVSWRPSQDSKDPRGTLPAMLAMQAEAQLRGLAAPFAQLIADAPDWGMRLQIAPLDVEFPQLVRVSDPAYVGRMLASAGAATEDAYRVSAIRYRPDQRHVLRYDPASGPGDATLFAKIYNSQKGAHIFGMVARVADWLAGHGAGMTAVRPQTYIADEGVVLYPNVSGTPLSSLLREPGPQTNAQLRLAGAALHALHRTPTTLVELHPHSVEKELKTTASACEYIHPLLPETGARIQSFLARAAALHERLPQEEPTFAYGDFKCDHLWVTPAGLTLIDFDTCYLFDPAIDIGKFLADLHYWYDGYGQLGVEQAQQEFLASYMPGAPAERLLRARFYETVVLVKATARRVRLFDPDWAERTARLIRRADELLATLEEAVGRGERTAV